MKHLKYGGSTMHRTINCSGWQALAEQVAPVTKSSPAAARGSALHDCMEALLNDVYGAPADCEGEYSEEHDYTVTADDVIALTDALGAWDALVEQYNLKEYDTEIFSQLIPNVVGGSADVVAFGPEHTLVVDWKFGHNPVDPTASWQGATYLLSLSEDDDLKYDDAHFDKQMVFVIIQPTTGEGYKDYAYATEELDEMYDTIIKTVEVSETGAGVRQPGDHCQFCPGAPICDVKIVQAKAALDLPADVTLDLETALALTAQLEPWVTQVKTFAHEMLEQGATVPGWKLVEKRATRKWADEAEVTTKLKGMRRLKLEDYSNIVTKTAPQLEKVCKAKDIDFNKEFASFVVKKSSGTTLAPEDDKRPAVSLERNAADTVATLGKLK
tara:strand:+ start:693 stop:1844 length:1152 start_codon:yes stop_codon:yes gene_type:complete